MEVLEPGPARRLVIRKIEWPLGFASRGQPSGREKLWRSTAEALWQADDQQGTIYVMKSLLFRCIRRLGTLVKIY